VYRQRVETAWPGLGGRLNLNAESRFELNLNGCSQVRDLTPLKGMPLTSLNLDGCKQVRDLTPLKGVLLTSLSLARCGDVEFPRKSGHEVKGYPACSYSAGER
jgi:hypothetical protein